MKPRLSVVALLVLLAAAVRAQAAHVSPMADRLGHMVFLPLQWRVPPVSRVVLPNGTVVFLREDHTLPLVDARVLIRTGSVYERLDQHGVAYLTGMLLRSGGTTTLTPAAVNSRLAALCAQLRVGVGTEQATASLDVLSDAAPAALRLLGDVLMHPRFAPEAVLAARERLHQALRRRNDDPREICGREFDHLIYGAHPYGWELQWPVIARIRRPDLVAWYGRFFHPSRDAVKHPAPPHSGQPDAPGQEWRRPNIMIAISWDFQSAPTCALLKQVFGAWTPARIAAQRQAPVVDKPVPGVFLIKQPLARSHVVVGHLSVDRYSPDFLPLKVMDCILGRLRMKKEILEHASFDATGGTALAIDTTDRGTFSGWLDARANETHGATEMLLDAIQRMADGKVTREELDRARDACARSFIFSFQRPADAVDRVMQLEFDNLPADDLQTWLARVQAVSAADVARVARRYLRPKDLTILVVGDPAKFDRQFTDLGPVKVIPLQAMQ